MKNLKVEYNTKIKELIFEADKFFAECHATTVLTFDNQDVLTAWFGGTKEKNPDVSIWLARRVADRWCDPVKIADKEDVPCWNPVLFKEKNRVWLYYKVGPDCKDWYTMYMTSDDEGHTWSQPKELVKNDIGGRGPVKNKSIVVSNGCWLAPASNEQGNRWDSFVDISKDQGSTWGKSNVISLKHSEQESKEGVIQPSLWESELGHIHMLLRSNKGYIYRSDSYDFGQNWCDPYATVLPNNNSGLDVTKLENGALVLAYNPTEKNWGKRTPISLSVSVDNGDTWSEPYNLEYTIEGEYSYPAIIAKGNEVFLTYTWNRKRVAFWNIDIQINT